MVSSMYHIRELPSSLCSRGMRCPSLHILECKVGRCICQHQIRIFPNVSKWSILKLIKIHRLSSLGRNLKVEARPSILVFIVRRFSKNLTLGILGVGSINRGRSLDHGHTPWDNNIPNNIRGDKILVRDKGTPISKLRRNVWGHSLEIGSNKPICSRRKHVLIHNSRYHSLHRSFDNGNNINNNIGHPKNIGDIGSIKVSRGRLPLSLENLQYSLHVSLKKVNSSLDLGEDLLDSSVIRFVINHDSGFVGTGVIAMTIRRSCYWKDG